MSVGQVHAAAGIFVHEPLTLGAGTACGWIYLGAKSLGRKIRMWFPFAGSLSHQNGIPSVVTPHQVTEETVGLSFSSHPTSTGHVPAATSSTSKKYIYILLQVHISSVSSQVGPLACLSPWRLSCKLPLDLRCPFFSRVACFVLVLTGFQSEWYLILRLLCITDISPQSIICLVNINIFL